MTGTITARPRDSKGLSESDWTRTHAKVYLPTFRGGYELIYVKILSGDHLNGTGVIDDVPKRSALTMGTQIAFAGGTESGVKPKFVRKLHRKNQKDSLIEGVAKQLQNSLQFNPERQPNETKGGGKERADSRLRAGLSRLRYENARRKDLPLGLAR